MKNRISRLVAMLAILCVMVTLVAVPLASAASYSKVYGRTQDRIRVRESASTNATIIDNIVKDACVYVTTSKASGNSTFVQIKYRNADGDVTTGWACQYDGKTTYIKILSADQASKTFGVKSGDLPSKKVGTFTASERKASANNSDNTYIKLNSSGAAVKSMQQKLKKLGYYSAEETGNAGPKTVAAIKDFQSKNGLTADGVAGPATLAKIDAAYDKLGSSSSSSASSSSNSGSGLRLNSNGTDVRDLQTDLTTLGYYWATISGNFGEKTETAVKRFQEENGLTVDGVAGKKTLDAIAKAVAAKGGSSASSSNNTSGVLKLDSQGTKVSQLQTDLTQLGYYYASVSGHYGEKTEAAVKNFQKKNGLTADGIAGAKTLAAIAAAVEEAGGSVSSSSGSGLKLGTVSQKVAELQEDLTTLGYYYGDVTKHFGQLTQQAVKKFQKAHGLTVDGVAGDKTLAAIEAAVKGTGNKPASGSSSGSALRKGDTNNVKIGDMQKRLKSLGYYYGEITNNFGDLTEKAVKKFQDDNNLTVDGVAGNDTLNKLYSLTGGSSTSSDGTTSSGTTVTTENSYGQIIKNNVYLRSKASTSSAAKASLSNGTKVRIEKIYTTADNVKWYYITVKLGNYTYKGYVRSDMMQTITAAEYGSGSDVNVSDQETLGMIVVTGDNVRLRYSPSTDAEIVDHANKGDAFYYVDLVDNWYQTKSGYWIHNSNARRMTSTEVDNYVGSDSVGNVSVSYRYGSTGTEVTNIQRMLIALGYNYGGQLKDSGYFGYKTEDEVKAFQRDHNLSADGVVGKKTLEALTAAYNGSSTGGTTSYDSIVYNLSWTKYKSNLVNLGLNSTYSKTAGNVKITDLWTGKTFSVYVQSTGNHADVEPSTASDTAVMCSIYGVSNAKNISWERRPILVSIGAVQVVASMYGEPHGQQNITNNNFNGQFCVHFLDSTIHTGDGGSIPAGENHQDRIKEAVDIMTKKGSKVETTYTTSQQK